MTSSAYAWPRFGGLDDQGKAEQARLREEAAARGYAEGRARAEAEFKQQREALARAIGGLPEQIERLGHEQAEAVTGFALGVARELLTGELRTNPEVLRSLVAEALEELDAALGEVRVLVNPADRDWLIKAAEAAQLEGERVDPTADASVPPGGVSIQLGARSVEFDPLARLQQFLQQNPELVPEQEVPLGTAGSPPG